MGCGCNNKPVIVQPYVPKTSQVPLQDYGCIIDYFNELKNKLEIMKTTDIYINTTMQETNSILGLMQTMENYNNYCLYDLSSIQSRVSNVN